MSDFKYCSSLSNYRRFKTQEVNIGGVPLGNNNPIRIQSMTTTDTMNTEDTINQSIRMIKAGSEYVRITAPSINEAKNLKNIQNGLKLKGYKTPLIADIHFTPNAAEIAAEIVPKVRINPGNYADRKKFDKFEISDEEYNLELERIYTRFSPLVKLCKENGTAMRIGTNHGSLSDRIMNRYGDTPLGMVESALEFIRICRDHNFHNIILSMKSSNPIVMVNAYRLLVNKMMLEEMNYPLHLGVTEAGDGMEGRIKSSIGIGALLEDGLGDTIRVSLTEEPELELPIAKKIVDRYKSRNKHETISDIESYPINPFEYSKRNSDHSMNIGGKNVPRVIIDLSQKMIDYKVLSDIGYTYLKDIDKWNITDLACDYIHIGSNEIDIELPIQLGVICDYSKWTSYKNDISVYPEMTLAEYSVFDEDVIKFVYILSSERIDEKNIKKLRHDPKVILILDTINDHGMPEQRKMFIDFIINECRTPIVISRYYENLDYEEICINSSIDIGALLLDGLGDGILISSKNACNVRNINELSFGILQGARTRVSKTEFISCPSCGRTQFDLQETTARVRKQTSHLKGLKIAVMGCIVNGPGEMADADYGYVGTGKEQISLYKGHKLIKRNINAADSINELIQLIKSNNDWIDPE